jgi:DNA processing protein
MRGIPIWYGTGIDQSAHEGAIDAGGPAIAVLACGAERVYPPGATPLAREILRCGRIVSEMPIGTPPFKNHFPRRNRILAALGRATLVIEADVRSGSLSTASRALEIGRDVWAVPGPIDAATSRGANRLIRDGAHPLLEVGDLDLLIGAPQDAKAGCGSRGAALLAALAAPLAADELARRAGLAVDAVLLALVDLEAGGRVERLGGGLFVRVS